MNSVYIAQCTVPINSVYSVLCTQNNMIIQTQIKVLDDYKIVQGKVYRILKGDLNKQNR